MKKTERKMRKSTKKKERKRQIQMHIAHAR